MKKGMNRKLAALLSILLIFQTVAESGVSALAATPDGQEVSFVSASDEEITLEEKKEPVEEEPAEEEKTSEEEDKEPAEDEKPGNGGVELAGEESDNSDEDAEEAEDVEEEEAEIGEALSESSDGKIPGGAVVESDGRVTYGEKTWGTFEAGVFTIRTESEIDNQLPAVFRGWEELTEIRFAADSPVYKIEASNNGAFTGCINLEKVDFTNAVNLTFIEKNAFKGCTKLSEVIFNEDLQTIGDYAFSGCAELTELTINKGAISLGKNSFANCSKLEKVTMEATNLSINNGSAVFQGCKIKSFELQSENPEKNKIVPAYLFQKAGFDSDCVLAIPDYVEEIGDYAFSEATGLKEVTLHDRITTLGKYAFNKCPLTSLDLKKVQTINERAFSECSGLTELTIPNSVTYIGNYAFYKCTGLAGASITLGTGTNTKASLGEYIFSSCSKLEEITIPEGNEYVGKGEFSGCSSLTKVTFSGTVKEFGDETFASCSSLKELVLPANTEFVTIPGKCFEKCTLLETVQIREGITTIGNSAFSQCGNFTSNTLPQSLVSIGTNAFYKCKKFGDLTLPQNVTTIGASAFEECEKINKITVESAKITSCGEKIFYKVAIVDIEFPMTNGEFAKIPDNLFNKATWIATSDITIPYTVGEIGKNAFAGANGDSYTGNFKNINIQKDPETEMYNLTKIGDGAFQYAKTIDSFILPDSLTYIGSQAFLNCAKLEEITIPEKVTYIGTSAFQDCKVLGRIYYNAEAVTSSCENIFKGCNINNIQIGSKVRLFPAKLFKGAQFAQAADGEDADKYMLDLVIPRVTEKIGEYALPNVSNLRTVSFESGSVLSEIGQYAFSSCVNLTSCSLPDSVVSVGNYAFSGCEKLSDFKLPSGLTTLGSSALRNCKAIQEISLGSGLSKVPEYCFYNCSSLRKVEYISPSGITQIDKYAFYGCTSLQEITIPDTVTKLGDSCYEGCTLPDELNIPRSVTGIGSKAFYGCAGLINVYIPSTVNTIGDNAFDISYKDTLIFHVLQKSPIYTWLVKNKFIVDGAGNIVQLWTITYVLGDKSTMGNQPSAGSNPDGYEDGDKPVLTDGICNGWTFKGWYLDEAFTQPITSLEGESGDLTIYAKWEVITYTITYDLRGGTNDEANPKTYTTADNVSLKNPTKEGYTSQGWYTDLSDTKSKVSNLKGQYGDLVLHAKWNGGTVGDPKSSVKEGEVRLGTEIKLSSATQGATIFYTMDGSDPGYDTDVYESGKSKPKGTTMLYKEPISLSEAAEWNIKAIAVKDDSTDSKIVSFTYTVIDESSYWGDIAEGDKAGFESADKVPEGIWFAGFDDATYTGSAITLNIRVYDNKTRLKEGTDYTVKYKNNKNAAGSDTKKPPTVMITGKGNYSIKESFPFSILPRSIEEEGFAAAEQVVVLGKKAVTPAPVLTWKGTKLKLKKEYKVTNPASISSAGEYDVILEGVGNYTGTITAKCIAGSGTSIAKAKVIGLESSVKYTGSPITQDDITIQLGKTYLTKDEDYTISYEDNTSSGKATIVIRGKGNYAGEKRVSFNIEPEKELTEKMVSATAVLDNTGTPVNATVVVKDGNTVLQAGSEYSVLLPKFYKPGTSVVSVTGRGKYGGTVKLKLAGAAIDSASVTFLAADGSDNDSAIYGMAVGGVKPLVSVTLGGVKLMQGVDYTLEYKNFEKAGNNAELTIRGKGKYSGSLKKNYQIQRLELTELFGYAPDVQYKQKPGLALSARPLIYDEYGRQIGADNYTLKYTYVNATKLVNGTEKVAGSEVGKGDIAPANTWVRITATAKANGNYTGSFATDIKLTDKSIAKVKFKVADQYYTGAAIEPDKSDISISGKNAPTGNDYEIVGCLNNVKKGTGKLILRGVGDFGGTKVVNFKIKPQPLKK